MSSQTTARIPNFTMADLLQPVIRYLKTKGVSTEQYLTEAGISSSSFGDQSDPIPLNLIFEFFRILDREEGLDDIGLQVGQDTFLNMLGDFGLQLLRSKNIHSYLKKGCALISTNASGSNYWLVEEEDAVRFCIFVAGVREQDGVQSYLYDMMITVNTIRQALNEPWCPTELTVPGITKKTITKLSMIVPGTKIITKGEFACMPIPRELLDIPMPLAAQRTSVHMLVPSSSAVPTDFRAAIDEILEHLIIVGRPDIQTVSAVVGLNTRTLQRRLAELGSNFTEIVSERRVVIAMRWLADNKRPVAEIAHNLGYSDPTNFSRAFRRITGVSPKAYRDSVLRASSVLN